MAIIVLLAALAVGSSSAADAVVLRDGKVVLGQIIDAPPRGKLRVVVRRAWAREVLPDRAAAWEKAEAGSSERARRERLERLEAWRRDRAAEAGDRVIPWLDAQIARL